MTHDGDHIKNMLGIGIILIKDVPHAILNYMLPDYIYVFIKG